MSDLHLPAPDGVYGTAVATLGSWRGIADVVEKMGPRVTVKEAFAATTQSELRLVIGGLIASAYVGASIGSMAVATWRKADCGITPLDRISFARIHFPDAPWLRVHFQRHPEIFDYTKSNRRLYGVNARAQI